MKYAGMPMGMWMVFSGSFTKNLTDIFGIDKAAADEVRRKAKPKYKEIITELPSLKKPTALK